MRKLINAYKNNKKFVLNYLRFDKNEVYVWNAPQKLVHEL